MSNDLLETIMAPTADDRPAPSPGNGNDPISCAADEGETCKRPAHEPVNDNCNGPERQQEGEDGSILLARNNAGPEAVESSNRKGEQDDEDEFERRYNERFRSIRSGTGLEVGIRVSWPGTFASTADSDGPASSSCGNDHRGWELSTCLSSDCIAPLFHGTQWAGTRVWRAAVVALEYLLSDEAEFPIGSDHTLLELGCGLGVPGMVLHALRKCTTILTDMGDLIPTVHENVRQAFPESIADDQRGARRGTIEARELDWSVAGVHRLRDETGVSNFDVVLNCDCIFEPLYGDSWKHLLQCQVALLERNPSAYVLTSVERRNYDGIEKYLQAASDSGLVPIPVHPKRFAYPPQVELYRLVQRTPVVAPDKRSG
jgi:Lysine methyltransferase